MRTDCHVHLEQIGPPHQTLAPTVEEFQSYVRQEVIDLVVGIYEHDEVLSPFFDAGIEIIPFYWERTPLTPQIPTSAEGLKLHPFIDNFVLSPAAVGPAMEEAAQRGLPVLIHSDDRKPHLSRGKLFAVLAEAFPHVPIIIAHSGSYAPQSDERETIAIADEIIRELVSEAIEVTLTHENLYLEVSILARQLKAKLIAERAPLDRILIGSDFPIGRERCGSVLFQERALLEAGLSDSAIAKIYENARKLLDTSENTDRK
jgi:predicted TIM-barrel fold metal-dependent hydrolase